MGEGQFENRQNLTSLPSSHMYTVKWNTLKNTAQHPELVVNSLNFPFFCSSEENSVVV